MGKRSKTPVTRDDVIWQARYGKIAPEEAEAIAKAQGWEPFEQQPELPDFDPMRESRWSIVMAVAWIAWRDLKLVREQCAAFRSKCTHWIFRPWNESLDNGETFAAREGYFLESWHEATTVRLSVLEKILTARNQLPSTSQVAVGKAQEALWHSLSDKRLVAEALDKDGTPVDVPAREWSYLKLYEEGKRDVVKYDPLDLTASYTKIKLKRNDLLGLWPMVSASSGIQPASTGVIDALMISPISAAGKAGYVPLCSALHWLMTKGGVRDVSLSDEVGWKTAVHKLFPGIETGEVELIGMASGAGMPERLPGHTIAMIRVLAPLSLSIGDMLLDAPSHISCTAFVGQEEWMKGYSDQLFLRFRQGPAWTHLQVRKDQVLKLQPRPPSMAKPERACYEWLLEEMSKSPQKRPKSKAAFLQEAKQRFPPVADRQFLVCWKQALAESGATAWVKPGPIVARSDHSGN